MTFAWRTRNDVLQPQILTDAPFESLSRFDGALGGVRVLINDGILADVAPGIGGTTLKCSRTSVAWDDENFYILSVRDPDGEKSSVVANSREKNGESDVQRGGWDVKQVQEFWRQSGMRNALLFDGGESTQIRWESDAKNGAVHSSYHFTRTLGFWRDRPLRVVWPMLPPDAANGGVLNWFYVAPR